MFILLLAMEEEDSSDLIIEALEVFIHQILYFRNVYPSKIFQQQKAYNCPVFISIYPKLNNYIIKVLKTAKALINSNQLHHVEVVLYRNEKVLYESYTLETKNKSPITETDSNLINLEEDIRKALLLLPKRIQHLNLSRKDVQFKINLHTTQSEFIRISNDPTYQDFPWMQETVNNIPTKKEIQILPLTMVNLIGFHIFANIY